MDHPVEETRGPATTAPTSGVDVAAWPQLTEVPLGSTPAPHRPRRRLHHPLRRPRTLPRPHPGNFGQRPRRVRPDRVRYRNRRLLRLLGTLPPQAPPPAEPPLRRPGRTLHHPAPGRLLRARPAPCAHRLQRAGVGRPAAGLRGRRRGDAHLAGVAAPPARRPQPRAHAHPPRPRPRFPRGRTAGPPAQPGRAWLVRAAQRAPLDRRPRPAEARGPIAGPVAGPFTVLAGAHCSGVRRFRHHPHPHTHRRSTGGAGSPARR